VPDIWGYTLAADMVHTRPPKAKKQAHASGGIHATEAQAPPVATSGAQKPAAVVTHAVHVAGPASALGSL
jgi:hypothetical protein